MNAESRVERAAARLARTAGLATTGLIRSGPLLRAWAQVPPPVQQTRADAHRAWTGSTRFDDVSLGPIAAEVTFEDRESTGFLVVSGPPTVAAAQLVLLREQEFVIAVSQQSSAADVGKALAELRSKVLSLLAAGRTADRLARDAMPRRHDFPRTIQGQQPGFAYVSTSPALVLAIDGPPIAETVTANWLAFEYGSHPWGSALPLPSWQDVPPTVLGLALTDMWAWAAVDELLGVLHAVLHRPARVMSGAERQRYVAMRLQVGGRREDVLDPARAALLEPRHRLPGRAKSIADRAGIRSVVPEELDTLLLTAGDGRSLRVRLLPAWIPDERYPVRSQLSDGQLDLEIHVGAAPLVVRREIAAAVITAFECTTGTAPPASTTALLRAPSPAETAAAGIRVDELRRRTAAVTEFLAEVSL